MQIGEFVQTGVSGKVQAVVDSGEPLPLTRYDKPHATVVPTALWQEAEAALLRERARQSTEASKSESSWPHSEPKSQSFVPNSARR